MLFAANSTQIHTYGTITLKVDLNLKHISSWSFIIADIPSAIIEADFLAHYNLLIDLKNQQLVDTTTSRTTKGEILRTIHHNISTIDPKTPYSDLYIEITKPYRQINLVKSNFNHRIITNGLPISERPRKLTEEKAKAAKAKIELLVQTGACRPSSSQWASPIHLVKKNDTDWRLCRDYRKLNAVTVPDNYPPLLIQNLFQLLHGKKVFSTFDLERTYHQVPMHEEDIGKTAITWGLYEYVVMPFGLKNATQTFQRYIDSIFRCLDFVFIYIDDILVMSEDADQHKRHLEQVFQKLNENKLSINTKKCIFGQSEVKFLGYDLSSEGFTANTNKIQAIMEHPRPKTIVDLRRFLGMTNYYRRCLPNAAKTQTLLNNYLKE